MSPEDRGPTDHPLRAIKKLADKALVELSPVFDAGTGRPSTPPERLLKSSLLMALYTVRSERQFCEQLDYNLLCSLVPPHGHGRGELRADGVHEES